MKKVLLLSIVTIILSTLFFSVACNSKGEEAADPAKYTVTVIIENPIDDIKKTYEVEDGGILAPLLNDKQKGYSYYTSRTGTIEWNIYKDEVTCDMTLYAKAN